MFAWRPLKRAESWSAPSPGLPAGPDTSTRPEDKSPTPSTMDYSHGPGASPGPHPMESFLVPALKHPHGGEAGGFPAHLVRPTARDESLVAADPTKARNTTTQEEAGRIHRIVKFFRGA